MSPNLWLLLFFYKICDQKLFKIAQSGDTANLLRNMTMCPLEKRVYKVEG